jgi:uncharacterized protein (TIGR03118 family)
MTGALEIKWGLGSTDNSGPPNVKLTMLLPPIPHGRPTANLTPWSRLGFPLDGRRPTRRLSATAAVWIAASVSCAAINLSETDLVTDDPIAHPAVLTDASLVNPWGIVVSGGSPFWIGNNGTKTSTLYRVNPNTQAVTEFGLTVTIPGAGSVTGVTFDPSPAGNFNGDLFLFASEDGTVSGWRGGLGTAAETLVSGSANNIYKGSALSVVSGNAYLYLANFRNGTVDVLKGNVGAPGLAGNFIDPALPSGFAPFNVQVLAGSVYVTYAKQDGTATDEIPGAGNGYLDRFDLQGNFVARIGTGGTLNAPWGLALAPSSFPDVAGKLLVGNFGDGRINIYDQDSSTYLGQVLDSSNQPLVIDGLWGLTQGNNDNGGSTQSIYFTAGPDGESHGLFGVLSVPESTTVLPGIALLTLIGWTRLRGQSSRP